MERKQQYDGHVDWHKRAKDAVALMVKEDAKGNKLNALAMTEEAAKRFEGKGYKRMPAPKGGPMSHAEFCAKQDKEEAAQLAAKLEAAAKQKAAEAKELKAAADKAAKAGGK